MKQSIETIPEKDPMEKMHELVAGKDVHFDLRPVSLQETIDALKSLKARKSSGGLSIPKAIAKGAAEVLAIPLHRIISISIRDKVYAKAIKKVKGFPVFKKGSRQDKSCFRMVQNSEAAGTVFEYLVNAQLVQFLIQNELVPQSQYAIYGKGKVSCL